MSASSGATTAPAPDIPRRLHSTIAGICRVDPRDPRLPNLRRQLAVALVEQRIAQLVADAPALPAELRSRIAVLVLTSGTTEHPSRVEASAA